jgi:hypothetical protein
MVLGGFDQGSISTITTLPNISSTLRTASNKQRVPGRPPNPFMHAADEQQILQLSFELSN